MSGDSPNAFTNEHAFDFKDREGRASPVPTTSKEHHLHHQQPPAAASVVLVDPPKDQKDSKEDEPDFSSPTLNHGAEDRDGRRHSDAGRGGTDLTDSRGGEGHGKREDEGLLNGGTGDLPLKKMPAKPAEDEEEEEDEDTCLVNCIYYTMECCKCSVQ